MKKAFAFTLGAIGLSIAAPGHAAYVVDVVEMGGNVVATGSGSINLSALMGPFTNIIGTPSINPVFPSILLGPPPSGMVDIYNGGAGPISWGSGGFVAADAGTGNYVGASYDLTVGIVSVPADYVSNTPLGTSTATFLGQSFASLGLTPGSYVSTWGSGAAMDSFTVNVVAGGGIPEPASWAMMLLGLGAVGSVLRSGRQRQTKLRLAA